VSTGTTWPATVNRFCASSLQTTRSAFHAIVMGEADVVVSAGVECVSRYDGVAGAGQGRAEWWNARFAAAGERARAQAGSGHPWADPRLREELPDVHLAMGLTAENVAGLRGVSRQAQDEWALRSQHRAARAISEGWFDAEIVPVTVPGGAASGDGTASRDDSPRPGTTAEGLAALAPAFREGGTVTAGNCCPLSDSAAALVLMSDVRARELGVRPLARVLSTGVSALSPEIMGLGPVEASRRALHLAGMTVADLDLVELNEAFAAQVIPSVEELGLDPDRVNVHGGAIALGHPFGATGARMITTLLGALDRTDGRFGMAALCVGGGQGMAVVLERVV
jgi:acetyl-CoA C-acetyltransferase